MPPQSLVKPTQRIALTTVLNNTTPFHTSSHQERRPTQSLPSTNARRRDYTKEEKEAFEHWITNNPNPNRAQRVRYAQINGLVKSQVDNLINNRKRDLRRAERGAEQAAPIVNTTGGSATRQSDNPFGDDLLSQSESRAHENDTDMLLNSKLHCEVVLYSHHGLG